MLKFALKKVASLIPVLIFTTFIIFMVNHLSPGDPATFMICHVNPERSVLEFREMHGLNDPVLVQFTNYMTGIFRGDFGLSFTRNVNIADEIMERSPNTLRLGLVTLSSSLILSVSLGTLVAANKKAWLDTVLKYATLTSVSVPVFGLGLLLVVIFSLELGWLPSSGANDWSSIILPGVSLGLGITFSMIYSVRSSVLTVCRQGYIRVARANGLSKMIICKYVFRNTIAPILTAFRAHLGSFFIGMILVEVTFAWPGIGRLFIQGILARDYPMVMGVAFMFVLFYAVVNIALDIVMGAVDPRVRGVVAGI